MKTFTFLANSVVFLYFLIFPSSLMGQTKGSFETNVTFLGNPRQLAIYVPNDYNPANKYKLMVCLHGLGDNAVNYRNGLVNTLKFATLWPDAIFVCPEAQTTTSDYFEPAGGEQIIQAGIDYAKQNYNINDSAVFLQGFSLGGRAALRYGLEYPAKFKGLLLNTPALQGVKEATKKGAYTFNYTNANKIPIYITHGGTDVIYTAPIDSAYENLIINNGIVELNRFPAMGHTIPSVTLMDSLKFFYRPSSADFDAHIVKVLVPARTCDTKTDPGLLVRNTGKNPITDITVEYILNGSGAQTHTWSGNLMPWQHAIIPMPMVGLSSGSQLYAAKIISLNTGTADEKATNNQAEARFLAFGNGKTLPYFEGFESTTFPPTEWTINPSGDVHSSWNWDDGTKKTGVASAGAINTVLLFDNLGRKEEILSPVMDLTSLPRPHLTFDIAYQYHKYTPPFTTGGDLIFADSLEVLISTNCGNSYTSLFKKGGEELATFASPIINPQNIIACYANPKDSNWKKVLITLSAYSTANKAVISFRYTSALGGSINIDNVSFGNNALSVDGVQNTAIRLYPNPANDMVTIESAENIGSITIRDINGKLISLVHNGQQNTAVINTSSLSGGIYIFETNTTSGVIVNKVVISR